LVLFGFFFFSVLVLVSVSRQKPLYFHNFQNFCGIYLRFRVGFLNFLSLWNLR
jgi:hypothetical protein